MNPRITDVSVRGPYVVELTFTDGSRGTVDLGPWIRGRAGVFIPLHDPAYFAKVSVDQDAGTIAWPNGVDLDPDVLYEAARDASVGGHSALGGG
jgi:Protein of unknown function (DUF2442)